MEIPEYDQDRIAAAGRKAQLPCDEETANMLMSLIRNRIVEDFGPIAKLKPGDLEMLDTMYFNELFVEDEEDEEDENYRVGQALTAMVEEMWRDRGLGPAAARRMAR